MTWRPRHYGRFRRAGRRDDCCRRCRSPAVLGTARLAAHRGRGRPGHQAYCVAPIPPAVRPAPRGESGVNADGEAAPAVAAEDLFEELRNGPLAGLRVEMVHGQLPSEEKDAVMSRFAAGETDVLVATTVVEVGVDVPNLGDGDP